MVFRTLLLWRRRRPNHPPAGNGLVYEVEFVQRLIARERTRCERSGSEFSLLSFMSPAESRRNAAPSAWSPLIEALHERLRCTDDVGWLDDQRLAVLLPETPAAGAWKVADDILARLPVETQDLQCEVYTFPGDDRPSAGRPTRRTDAGRQRHDSRDNSRPERSDPHDRPAPPRPPQHPDSDRPLEEAARVAGQPPAAELHAARELRIDRPVQPMELLWAQGLPWWKRGLDIAGASVGLAAAAPLLLAAIAAVKYSSPGPAFFYQWRSGLGGRPFRMCKLRTMTVDAEQRKLELLALNEQDGPAFKLTADPRVTPVGRFLRRTSIDELPQLWNVLRGEMSLVGPRPLPCDEAAACSPWQRRRTDITPGLTCIWQIEGRSRVSFDEWVRMDLRYSRGRSPWLDLMLILRTAPAVLLGRGAK